MNIKPKLLIVLLLFSNALFGGSSGDFDFWIGHWKVVWEDAEGNNKAGTNEVSRILDDKIVYEQFDGNPGAPLVGRSWSAYVDKQNLWKQTWVDNNGSYLDFTGGMRDGQMVLTRKGFVKGKAALQRMRFYNIAEDTLDWVWEVSFDDGKSWKTAWQIHYTRLNKPDESAP